MFQILVAENSKNTARRMKAMLTCAGYRVHEAADGAKALAVMDHQHIDLIVSGARMPVMDGYSFAETLRAAGDNTPILMVAAKDLPEEKCRGFLAGADDYMVKPINEEELILRIRSLLRRSQIVSAHKLQIGGVCLDYDALTVSQNGASQTLPPKEFLLLYKLLSYPDKIFTRLQLMDEIWGMGSNSTDTTVNVHIARLRRRFASCVEFEIITVRGIGYKAVIHRG